MESSLKAILACLCFLKTLHILFTLVLINITEKLITRIYILKIDHYFLVLINFNI